MHPDHPHPQTLQIICLSLVSLSCLKMKGEEKGGFKEGGDERGKGIKGDEREGKKIVKNGECLVIDVEEDEEGRTRMDSEKNSKEERVCRICHFSKEPSSKEVNLISLGCDCKGELASSHHHCALTWFSHKGDRYPSLSLSRFC